MAATLNLGILAHVDAGKTTLTERLLYAAGVIDEIGSVDAGTTQTDFLELERQRGITIRTAVVSFPIDDVSVNLIDTPGHPDFIAEVERALSVLDGAVLVISAVEGVQPQTRVLMRALQRLRVPTLLFVNKIDRRGADTDRVVSEIARRLSPAIVPMGHVDGLGTRAARFTPWGDDDPPFSSALAETLAAGNDDLLAAYVEDESAVAYKQLREELAAQTKRALVHPVYFGSAVTGAGVGPLMPALAELLPVAADDPAGPVSGRTFKIERGPTGEKVAYVRLFSGTLRIRDRVGADGSRRDVAEKVTAISVFDRGAWVRRAEVRAGEIGKLWGLAAIRVGDAIGDAAGATGPAQFAPPTLETVVVPRRGGDRKALRVALAKLAEQDPLINVRQDDARHEISVSLYGEVQKEVIQATLATDFGVDVTFSETTVICVERPARAGEAVEVLHGDGNPFLATIGLRIEPAPPGSGVEFRLRVDTRTVPIYVYRNAEQFADVMGGYVRRALREGLYGWEVTDCVVTMHRCNYSSPAGPPSTRGPLSSVSDFRNLTPIVVMEALAAAGTVVCEPVVRAHLEVPVAALGPVLSAVGRVGGSVRRQAVRGEASTVESVVPAARIHELQGRLPGLTSGEGVLESAFGGYQPVRGEAPSRPRTTPDPRHREEYLAYLTRQGAKS